jgi:hypothetical protein
LSFGPDVSDIFQATRALHEILLRGRATSEARAV